MNQNPIENPPIKSAAAQRQSANWDIRNAPKNYTTLILAQGGSAFFAFATVWLITRMIGAEGYGGVYSIIAASQVAQVLVNWTHVSVVRFGVDEFIDTEKITRTFWLRTFIIIPNILLVLLASNLWFPPLAEWLKLPANMFWLVFLHFTSAILWLHIQAGLQAVKMLKLQGILVTVERIFIFTTVLTLFAKNNLTVYSATFCYAVIPLLMVLIGFYFLKRFIFTGFFFDWDIGKKIFIFSVPLIPFTLVGYFSGSYVDAVFINKFLSIRDLGIYSVATQIAGITLQFPTIANSLLTPFFITLQKETRTSKLHTYFRVMLPSLTLGWSFFCVLLATAGYIFIPIIFGNEFSEAVAAFLILLTGSVFSLPILIGYSALSNAASKTYIAMFAAIFSAITNIFFNFLLIPKYGIKGCAWATVITYFVSASTFYLLLKKSNGIPLSWTFQATIPIVITTIYFSLTLNPFYSLFLYVSITILVIITYRASIKEALHFLKSLRG